MSSPSRSVTEEPEASQGSGRRDAAASAAVRLPHLPALDGLRAIALVSVLAFHAGYPWIEGGYLPLTSFFVLSGFLITSLLLLERQRSGRIDLRAFWGRRARRLVPAAIVALLLIAVYTVAVDDPTPGLRGDVFAALFWVANWRFIFSGQEYGDLWSDPSPLQHFWSLAVEEQFYLFLPLLATGCLLVARGRRWLLASVTGVVVVASTLWMRHLYEPGEAPLRSYFGTDTRAAELLVGVLLALALIGPQGLRRFQGFTRHAVNVAGVVALVASVTLWVVTQEYDSYLYESGGLLGIALIAAIVVTAGTQEGTVVTRVLSLRPLVAVGRISYGIYLFHWPLFLWLDEEATGLDRTPLFALRMAITVGLAVLSYRLVEQPIRTGIRVQPRLLLTGWANATVAVAAVLVLVTAVPVAPLVDVQTSDVVPTVERAVTTSTSTTTTAPATSTTAAEPSSTTDGPGSSSTAPPTSAVAVTAPPTTAAPTTTTAPLPPLKVMVVGDSIGVNLAGGLSAVKDEYQIDLLNYAFDGCAAVVDGTYRWPDGSLHTVSASCRQRVSEWSGQIASFDPDVVLVHSSIFDILDRKASGWADYKTIGDPVFDSWLQGQQRSVAAKLAAGGARVVWSTTPCAKFNPSRPNHHEDGEGNRRIDLLDGLIRRIGVSVAEFDSKVCPGGTFSSTVFGVPNARPDGVHFTPAAAQAIADQWLAPYLLSLRP